MEVGLKDLERIPENVETQMWHSALVIKNLSIGDPLCVSERKLCGNLIYIK